MRSSGLLWVGLAVALLGGAAVALVRAPVPATSGPASTALTGPESVPHTHVAVDSMANMPGMAGAAVPVGGIADQAGGYRMVISVAPKNGASGPFAFHIQGPDGRPVTRFAIVHDKPLHLIVVRKDLSGFQHLHPAMAPDGTWSVPLTLPAAGVYRAYADFTAIDAKGGQQAVVLGVDVAVPGAGAATPLPAPATSSTVDGYTVSYDGAPAVGVVEPMLFRITRNGTTGNGAIAGNDAVTGNDAITRNGAAVTPQPYLGAYGHLVMLRQTDLAYLHVHPEPALAGGAVKFWVAAPSPGTYRMYLDFQAGGQVHTAEFTLQVP
jgi:hypothetical protein